MPEDLPLPSYSEFHALTSGRVQSPFDDTFPEFFSRDYVTLRVFPLGKVKVPSGLLEVCDPFINLAECPAMSVPSGEHPVYVTVADVSVEQDKSHEREAYLSMIFQEGEVAEIRQAVDTEGNLLFVGVDSATVGFCDHQAARTCMPEEVNWYETYFCEGVESSWFDLMDSPDHYEPAKANIVFPLAQAGENIALTHSGWGDNYFLVKTTHDVDGNLLGVHVDLQILDLGAEEDEED